MKFISQDRIISVVNSAGFIRSINEKELPFDIVYLFYRWQGITLCHRINKFIHIYSDKKNYIFRITERFCPGTTVEILSLKFYKGSFLLRENNFAGLKIDASKINEQNYLQFNGEWKI